jgi:hypothetical protein
LLWCPCQPLGKAKAEGIAAGAAGGAKPPERGRPAFPLQGESLLGGEGPGLRGSGEGTAGTAVFLFHPGQHITVAEKGLQVSIGVEIAVPRQHIAT